PSNQSKVKGLATCNLQTTSPSGFLNNFNLKILSNFLGSVQYDTDFSFLFSDEDAPENSPFMI
uniref:hypothetical protein n=1 Tax=Anaerotignum lactatifermentans TaxID=160404 RepID=UPI003AB557B9